MDSRPKLSFGFSKTIKKPCVKIKTEEAEEKDYISEIKDAKIKSNVERNIESHIVIPVKKSNFGIRSLSTLSNLSETSKTNIHLDTSVCIPLETEKMVEVPDDADYDQIPIEKFGMAIMLGMGLKPKDIEDDKKMAEINLRPRGLGLGANPKAVKEATEKYENFTGKTEKLTKSVGSKCKIIFGKHKDLYGCIKGIYGDSDSMAIELSLYKKIVTVSSVSVCPVTNEEYNNYFKYINKIQADNFTKLKKEESVVDTDAIDVFGKDTRETIWPRKNLVVRFMNKEYLNGKYYKRKVYINDVNDGQCTCLTEEGHRINDVKQKYLQTIIPKNEGETVCILSNRYFGKTATLLKRDFAKNMALISLNGHRRRIEISLDCICATC